MIVLIHFLNKVKLQRELFYAISHAVNCFRISRSMQLLRADIVNYLKNNENEQHEWPLRLFKEKPFSDYMRHMSKHVRYVVLTVTK